MKKELFLSLRFPIFFSLVVAFIECILYKAAFKATFRGFGGVALEFTKIGCVAMSLLMVIPLLLMAAVIFARLVKLYRCKANKSRYVIEITGFVLGFGIGILLVFEFSVPLLTDLLSEVAGWLASIIEFVGWVKYPAP